MWPTMLAAPGAVPRGGALLMGLMGTAGTLSIRSLPMMGGIYDAKKIGWRRDAAFAALPAGPSGTGLGIAHRRRSAPSRWCPPRPDRGVRRHLAYDRSRGGFLAERLSAKRT
jgi:hypothetical protein